MQGDRNMKRFAIVALAASFLAAGCAGPSARVKSGDEGDLVDVRRGCTETYKELIRKGVLEILTAHRSKLGGAAEKPVVAFVGVDNKSSEELGEFRAAMDNEIETALVESDLYSMVSMEAVKAAKSEANIGNISQLTVGRTREAFMAVLNKDGHPPQYILFGQVTTMTSSGNEARERTYQLKLQMMDSSSGIIQSQKMVEMRKEYTK
jgi:hypothetical protein